MPWSDPDCDSASRPLRCPCPGVGEILRMITSVIIRNITEPEGAGAELGPDRVHAAGFAGRKAMASISIFAFSNSPATCTAVLVGGSSGKNSPRTRENTA